MDVRRFPRGQDAPSENPAGSANPQRSEGRAALAPDCASLHPGYGFEKIKIRINSNSNSNSNSKGKG